VLIHIHVKNKMLPFYNYKGLPTVLPYFCYFLFNILTRVQHGTGSCTGFYGIPSRNPGVLATNWIYGINPTGSRPVRSAEKIQLRDHGNATKW